MIRPYLLKVVAFTTDLTVHLKNHFYQHVFLDAWLILFMVITMLVNCRDHILEITSDRYKKLRVLYLCKTVKV